MQTKWEYKECDVSGGDIVRVTPPPLLWVCHNCGFSMDAVHVNRGRENDCPLCELEQYREKVANL